MLYLNIYNRQVQDLYPDHLRTFESDLITYGELGQGWKTNDTRYNIGRKDLSYTALPYFLHDINILHKVFLFSNRIHCYSDSNETDTDAYRSAETEKNITTMLRTFKNNILSIPGEEELDKDIIYIKCYTTSATYEQVLNGINEILKDTDIKPANGVVSSLYNKTLVDAIERNSLVCEMHANEWVSEERHILITLTNINDYENAADTFLSLGMFPALFTDIQSKMSETELNYCKELVHRSQVKRINNKEISEVFSKIDLNAWIKEKQSELYKLIIDKITKGRTTSLNQELGRYHEECERILNNYANALRKYKDKAEEIERLTNNTASLKDDLELAFSTQGIELLRYDSYSQNIDEIVTGPMTFYEQDELEILLSNSFSNYVNVEFIKQFLKDIFIDKKYKLYCGVHTFFPLNRNNARLELERESGSFYKSHNLFPNPHLQFYNCTGDYKPKLVQAIMDTDILMYNNILLASIKTYNFRDATVFSQLCHMLDCIHNAINDPNNYNYSDLESYIADSKCLEDAEGNRISIKEAYFHKEPIDIEVEDTL